MATFKDKDGRDWSVNLTIGVLETIKADLGVDLGNSYQNTAIAELDQDVLLLVKTMHYICDKQRQQREMTDEQFGEMMAGDTTDEAMGALQQALKDFFPRKKREILQTILDRNQQAWEAILPAIEETVSEEQMSDLIRRTLEEAKKSLQDSGTL